jgi:hypothetical protein
MKLTRDVWYEAWEGVGRRGGGPRAADSGTRRACLKSLSTTAFANPRGVANGRSLIGRAGLHRFYWVEERTTPRFQREIKFSLNGLERYL